MKKRIFNTSTLILAGAILALTTSQSNAFSVAEKAQKRQIQIIKYLRLLKPMVYNFPCEPFPECYADLKKQDKLQDAERITLFNELKNVYQEGRVYYFEGQYLKAYNRFIDSQSRTENILEKLSQFYINRTEIMMRDAMEKKRPNDPLDMTVVDISIEYGPNSRKRQDFAEKRESPHTSRRYNSKETHWAQNKWQIERNVKKGYEYLGYARQIRKKALLVDANLKKGRKVTPTMKQKRIEMYFSAIQWSRQAKNNAAKIYQLKYPYDNYVHHNQFGLTEQDVSSEPTTPSIENTKMNWAFNPYLFPKALHTVFDLRLPAKYRRDTTDSRNMIYDEEVDINIHLKYYSEEKRNEIKDLNFKKDDATPAKTGG